jgi:hypothetical protein
VGDGIAIVASKIQCGVAADVGYGLDLRGKTYVVCGPSTKVKGAGYVALIASDGHVYILSIKSHRTVSSRAPAGVVRRAALATVRIGDRVAIRGTSLLCDVIKVSGAPTLLCDYVDARGAIRANSFAFGISDDEVTSLRWDAAQHVHILKAFSER